MIVFTWGYYGWGKYTEQLVQAFDAVEAARGWGPPVFVDVRASRSVRAEGFRDKAFERKFGPDRYRWFQKLGNSAIVQQGFGLIDPARAVDLLTLAEQLLEQRRRLIYFCACQSPTAACHRHWVTPELLGFAEKQARELTVVEWPGYESERAQLETVEVKPSHLNGLGEQRKNLPLGEELPSIAHLGRPWYTPVQVVATGRQPTLVLTGPANYGSGGWQLPVLTPPMSRAQAPKAQRFFREANEGLPRSWPPPQEPAREFSGPAETVVHPGDSLEEAIGRLATGGILRLRAGTYRLNRPLTIYDSLQLMGDGLETTTVVCDRPEYVISLEGEGHWRVSGITVCHEGKSPAWGLAVDRGTLQVEACRFAGAVSNEQGEYGSGLLITGEAQATVRSSQAEGNEVGIDVAGTANAELEENVCTNNVFGILFGAESSGSARMNVCTECETGILVTGAASPMLTRNRCERNNVGIQYDDQSSGVAHANHCRENREQGIRIEAEASPFLQENDCLAEV